MAKAKKAIEAKLETVDGMKQALSELAADMRRIRGGVGVRQTTRHNVYQAGINLESLKRETKKLAAIRVKLTRLRRQALRRAEYATKCLSKVDTAIFRNLSKIDQKEA